MAISLTRTDCGDITHILVNPFIGGAEQYTLNLCRQFRKRGYRSSLLVNEKVKWDGVNADESLRTVRAAIRGDTNLLTPFIVACNLRRLNTAVLNVHDNDSSIPCCLGGHLARVPVVVTVHGFHCRWPFIAANHLIAVSQALREHLRAQGYADSRVSMIHNGVDTDYFVPGDQKTARQRAGLPQNAFCFIFVGRIVPAKGIMQLLRAFQQLACQEKRAHLLFVGQGIFESRIYDFVNQHRLHDRIHLMGFQADIRPMLAMADCLVLPSKREGFGLVLLEAMASGLATIATDVGGPREIIVQRETGLLIPPNDDAALLDAMRYAMRNPAWTSDAGQAGRAIACAKFDIQQQVDGVEDVYDKLLRK